MCYENGAVFFWTAFCRVLLSVALLGITVLTHTILRTYYNMSLLRQCWSWQKFRMGISKIAVLMVSIFLLSMMCCYLPIFIAVLGIPLENSLVEYINLTTILGIMIKPTIAYTKQNLDDLCLIINGLPKETDAAIGLPIQEQKNKDNQQQETQQAETAQGQITEREPECACAVNVRIPEEDNRPPIIY